MIFAPRNTTISVDPILGGFRYHAVDLVIPGLGFDIRIERWHDSNRTFSFHKGWRFDWDERLDLDTGDGSILHYGLDDRMSRFVSNPDGTYSPAAGWITSTLRRLADGRLELTTKSQYRHFFDSEHGRLLERRDPNGNAMRFVWNDGGAGDLLAIVDASGRTVEVEWDDAEGKLTVRDWSGRELVYGYDVDRFITSYTDPEGNVTTYTEGNPSNDPTKGNLTGISSITLPNGRWLDNFSVDVVAPLTAAVGKQVFGNGRTILYSYDWTNRKTTVTDGDRVTTYEYEGSCVDVKGWAA